MPLRECVIDGKKGWQYGNQKCFTGENGKRDSIRQMIAIFGPDKFQKHLHEKAALHDFGGRSNLDFAKAIFREEFPRGGADVFLSTIATYVDKDGGEYGGNPKDTGDGLDCNSLPMKKTKADPHDVNNDPSLDKEREEVGLNIVIPPYNEKSAPEQRPGNKPPDSIYTMPTKDDLTPKVVKSDDDDMDDTEAAWAAKWVFAYIPAKTRDKIPEDEFAGPHKSFPVRNSKDVKHALELVHFAKNPAEVKENILKIAHRKGLSK